MPASDNRDSRRVAILEGLALLVGAAVLSPLLSAVMEALPSRENTRLDELPWLAVSTALVGLALVGVSRIGYALLAKGDRARRQLPSASESSAALANPVQWERSSIDMPLQGEHQTPR